MKKVSYILSVVSVAIVVACLITGVGVYVYVRYVVSKTEAQETLLLQEEQHLVAVDTVAAVVEKQKTVAQAHMQEPKRQAEDNAQCGNKLISHPSVGTSAASADGSVSITLIDKRQNYGGPADTREPMIHSPKSANIHPNGKKYYINSLEGASTVVFDFETNRRLGVISHQFTSAQASLWAQPSGLWPVTHYTERREFNTFTGKPVESTFSHGGRYLWIPYYRRSFDINAQDPSAMAVIDTEKDQIIRMFETGPLPKMVQTSPDGSRIAVSHWGNNTVGVLDISSDKPQDWHYIGKYIVDYELPLNYSLTTPVNRDSGSGYALRGTIFTPDNRYLIVGCMGGAGGLAVIDIEQNKYLGRLTGVMENTRHLVLKDEYLYLSVNAAGYVQRLGLDKLYAAITRLDGGATKQTNQAVVKQTNQDLSKQPSAKTAKIDGVESCQVMEGARTMCLSPDGNYAFVACNVVSKICIIDTRKMSMIAAIAADSYPVGMDISACGHYLITTSQGRSDCGGNAVDIYRIDYRDN